MKLLLTGGCACGAIRYECILQATFNIFTSDSQPWTGLSGNPPNHEFYPPGIK